MKIELYSSSHSREPFDCGNEDLNKYFKTLASPDIKRGMAQVYVATENSRIVGYYSLSPFSIMFSELPAKLAKKSTNTPKGCILFLMSIMQTVEIPDNHRLTIDVPPEVPVGRANIIIQFPLPVDTQPEKTAAKDSPTPITDSLVGILSGIGDIDLDEIRMERLAKHLK
jgi:hypothetical protein